MSARCFLLLLWAVSAQADFFHFDSISNVSTYYFNYIYCNIWEGECQPNQDDATQQVIAVMVWTDRNGCLEPGVCPTGSEVPAQSHLCTFFHNHCKAIRDMVLRCPQTLFIFDEAEKLHPGLIDAIKPFMDHYDNVDGVSYRRAIFLFLSNIGGATINDVALDFWHSGQNREDIGMEDLEHRLRAETMESQGGFAQSELMSGHLIDFFVPFLPLEYRHIKLCARDAYAARGLETDEATLDEVAKAMLYVPKEERLFSAQGCKSIPQRINFFLP
uniref:Torsin family 3, member A n=1 Tax=Neolamprologus brichardi TaxID=32507 RepID=A0A3Q4HBU9_NEOBR